MRTIQLYGTAAATANDIAHVTIPSSTTLKQVQWALQADQVADGAFAVFELSKIPTSQVNVNGAQDPFFSARFYNNLVTSGMVGQQANGWAPLSVPCRQGEIIYLHGTMTNTILTVTFIIWYG